MQSATSRQTHYVTYLQLHIFNLIWEVCTDKNRRQVSNCTTLGNSEGTNTTENYLVQRDICCPVGTKLPHCWWSLKSSLKWTCKLFFSTRYNLSGDAILYMASFPSACLHNLQCTCRWHLSNLPARGLQLFSQWNGSAFSAMLKSILPHNLWQSTDQYKASWTGWRRYITFIAFYSSWSSLNHYG